MQYLADSSIVNRIIRNQVEPCWEEAVTDGMLAICEPVLHEVMRIAGKREYERLQSYVLDAFYLLPIPDVAWDYFRAIRNDLAKRSMHNMFSVTDGLVAAAAIHYKLTVLHNDKDFTAAARVFPHLDELRVPEL